MQGDMASETDLRENFPKCPVIFSQVPESTPEVTASDPSTPVTNEVLPPRKFPNYQIGSKVFFLPSSHDCKKVAH